MDDVGHDDADHDDLLRRVEVLEERDVDRQRLATGVERLTDETAGLNAILNKVDEQQQRLTNLGRQLSDIDARTALETESIKLIQKKERRDRRRFVALTVLPVALVLAALVFGLSEAAHNACEKRQESTRTLIALLDEFKSGIPQQDFPLARAQDRLEATLTVTCDEQYPMHLPDGD